MKWYVFRYKGPKYNRDSEIELVATIDLGERDCPDVIGYGGSWYRYSHESGYFIEADVLNLDDPQSPHASIRHLKG